MPLVTRERPPEESDVPACWSSDELSADGVPPEEPPDDVVFEILRASRRREVLRYLDAHGGETTIGALAEYIAALENDVDRVEITSSQRKRVYVGLYQAHLPKMDGYGVVEWDGDRGVVRLCDSAWWCLAYLYFDPAEDGTVPGRSDGPLATIRRSLGRVVGR